MASDIGQQQWQQAQDWERSFWDRYIKNQNSIRGLAFLKTAIKRILRDSPGDDSNYWWEEHFDGYRFVPANLANVVEFGCGPFTNLRRILRGRTARCVVASDPLARHYTAYKGHYLAEKWRSGDWLIDDHPLEECVFADGLFDLAVCINVLDHVRSVDLCLKNLIRVVRPGGLLILGQDLTNDDDLKATEEQRLIAKSDVGHPHKFTTQECLLPYLHAFKPVLQRVLPRQEGRLPSWHCGTFLFAGEKVPQ
jgi:SAM-dependent methyltransferase